MQAIKSTQSLIANTIKWGTIGGIVLIVASVVFNKGILEILPYPFVLIAALASVRMNHKENGMFKKLFATGFFTFLIMTLMVYAWICIIENHQTILFTGHVLRLVAATVIAAISSLVISVVVKYFK